MTSLEARDVRQRDLVPPAALSQFHVVVVGVGAIGRQVALQLAAMGAPAMTLLDDDVVSVENLAVQGFTPAELGGAKVQAVATVCQQIHPAMHCEPREKRWGRSTSLERVRPKLAVFACVDSMRGRRCVWETLRATATFYADGRMAGEVLRVLAADDPPLDTYYLTTLFDDARAHPARCTGRSTLYAASVAAGLMLARFALHMRGQAVPRDTVFNLAADELASL